MNVALCTDDDIHDNQAVFGHYLLFDNAQWLRWPAGGQAIVGLHISVYTQAGIVESQHLTSSELLQINIQAVCQFIHG
jgi:hypothetical protein